MASSLSDYRRLFFGDSDEELATLKDANTNGVTAATLVSGTYVQDETLWSERGYDAIIPRQLATATSVAAVVSADQNFVFATFTAPADMVCSGVRIASGGTAAAGATNARLALYHVGVSNGGAESLLPLARIDSDTTLFTATNTLYERSWSAVGGWPSTVRLVRGQRYALGYQMNPTTAPTFIGGAYMRIQVSALTVKPLIAARTGGMGTLTDLPDYIPSGSLAAEAGGGVIWWGLVTDPASTKQRPLRTSLTGDSYFGSFAGWFGYGNAQAGSPLLPVLNDGVGGQSTDQMLARIAATLAVDPELVVLHGGINDVANTVTAATIQGNIQSIIDNCVGVGSQIVVCTIPPSTSMDAAELTTLETVNTWIMALAQGGVHPADTGRALTTGDGVTQDAALYRDGVHPNQAGRQAMANVLDDVLVAFA